MLALVSSQTYDMECIWCMNVVTNAQTAFGQRIANVSNVQFLLYFRRECRLDERKSPVYAGVCFYMLQTHPLILFNDLRHNATALETCNDCGFCIPNLTAVL
ncbi:hypothetical protein Q1695_008422 [Nippostrongylus brasiliensis]|nr:hypothetical protein Q1695_008422 [Nippostrongylus brasiliensis]